MHRNRLFQVAFLWDSVWKLAALAVALRRRDWKWLGPLLIVSSAGLFPIFYLSRTRPNRPVAYDR